MSYWQQIIVLIYAILNFAVFFKGIYEVKNKKNVFGISSPLGFLGIFVWGDAIVICLFWFLACIVILFINNWYLFLLTLSVFWAVRSHGEIIYWLNEQFAGKNRNPPHTLRFYKFFNNDSIWFIYQIFWQCIFVASLISSLYFAIRWFNSL